MLDAANYARDETLRDGTRTVIRSLRPDDETGMLAALEQASKQSLQRRFFAPKRHFSDRERSFFMNADFKNHVALVACTKDADMIIGGGRYIVFEASRAELAFFVVDAWQGRGLGGLLTSHLIGIARAARLSQLRAEVLPENVAMSNVLKEHGFGTTAGPGADVAHWVLDLT
ncbi:GCN5 family acetyltransferase [Bradyrhizobium sp. CCGE-LA001]|nr:GCN5 family acetyltransferase [Bradyrhizobium sp. CCGE-LA001]